MELGEPIIEKGFPYSDYGYEKSFGFCPNDSIAWDSCRDEFASNSGYRPLDTFKIKVRREKDIKTIVRLVHNVEKIVLNQKEFTTFQRLKFIEGNTRIVHHGLIIRPASVWKTNFLTFSFLTAIVKAGRKDIFSVLYEDGPNPREKIIELLFKCIYFSTTKNATQRFLDGYTKPLMKDNIYGYTSGWQDTFYGVSKTKAEALLKKPY